MILFYDVGAEKAFENMTKLSFKRIDKFDAIRNKIIHRKKPPLIKSKDNEKV